MRLGFEIPDGYHLDFEEYLFNTGEHRKTQSETGWRSFYLIDDEKKLVKASCHLNEKNRILKSPYSATFGGIDFSDNLTKEDLKNYLGEIDAYLKKEEFEQIAITLAPSIYNEARYSKLHQALSDNGYELKESIPVSAIYVDEKSFDSKVNTTKKKVLRRTKSLEVQKMTLDDYPLIYKCIHQSKEEKQYNLSMTELELKKVIDSCSERIKQYAVFVGGEMAAAMICMQIASNILYVFYSGHLPKFDKQSPLVQLYQFVYNDCKSNGIRMIDLGSSQEDGKPKQSLLDFKASLGAHKGLKVNFIKKL